MSIHLGWIDMYITGELQYKNIEREVPRCQEKSTDVHGGVRSGIGLFNWRMKFDIDVPCKYPRLSMMLWNQDYLSANDSMGLASLDLSGLLKYVFFL